MRRLWMPMYWGDYLSDTGHLSTLEHGAYLLLIAHYWQTGCLPTDEPRLARIAKLDSEQWSCVRNAIASLFSKNWTHTRIDKELEKSEEKSKKATDSASKRWNKTEKPIMRTQCEGNANAYANAMLTQHNNILDKSNILPPSKTKNRKALSELAEDAEPTDRDQQAANKASMSHEQLAAEWQSFKDYHRARANRMADWSAAWRTWVSNFQKFKQSPRAGPKKQTGLVARATLELKRQMEFENGSKTQAPGAHEAVEFLPFRTING